MPYTDEELLEELVSLAGNLGHTPRQRDVNDREGVPSSTTYYHRFGGWSDALVAAGLEPDPRGSHVADDDLLEALEELAVPPTASDIDAHEGTPASDTYVRRFGSLSEALQKAGIGDSPWCSDQYSTEELLNRLRAVAADFGRPPTWEEMKRHHDAPDPKTYARRFGSWSRAIQDASLETESSEVE